MISRLVIFAVSVVVFFEHGMLRFGNPWAGHSLERNAAPLGNFRNDSRQRSAEVGEKAFHDGGRRGGAEQGQDNFRISAAQYR